MGGGALMGDGRLLEGIRYIIYSWKKLQQITCDVNLAPLLCNVGNK